MPTLNITWQSERDASTCQKCRALNGYEWVFTDEMPTALTHPQYGVVWDLLADQSRAHGNQPHNCRCTLAIYVDDADVAEDLEELVTETDVFVSDIHNQLNAVMSLLKMLGDIA